MRKLRVGNDFWQSFQIKEKGVIADLLQVKDTVQVFAKVGDKCFEVPKEMVQIKEDGIITMEVKTELFNIVGRYEIIVKYWHHDISMSDQDRKQTVNFMPFVIVGKTEMADSSEDIPIVGDIIIGLKGDSAFDIWNIKNGGNNTYDDWIDFLQAPATQIEGIVSANETVRIENENTRKANEQTRQSNESARATAEIDRESNEDTRSLNEAARLTNEDDRIANENQRVIDEGKREQLYDNTVILKGEVETLKTETETAKDNAITATNQINTVVIPNAETAIQNAIDVKTDYETVVKPDMIAKTNYAQEQGDYAKEKGDLADTARLAIQADLELKANQTDLVQLESDVSELELKDVVQSDKIKDIENVISTMNPNQSAQLSLSGVSPLSLPKNAANGGMSVKLEGLTVENLVVNGDFRDGTTGWAAGASSTNLVTNGTLTNTGNGGHSEPNAYREIGNKIVGNKYYLRANVTAKSALCTIIRIGSIDMAQTIDSPIVNNPYLLSGVITASTAYNYIVVYHLYASSANANGGAIEVDNVMAINLTTTFGAGNEPTKEQCDLIFSDYFEGVKSFEPTGRVRSVDKNGLNPTALYLTAPELRSNGTVKDEIRKGANGYELVKRISDIDGTILATPVISPINYGGVLNSAENGTVYHEPIIADAGVYGTNMPILLTDYPIASIEEITKHENGVDTYLNATTAVIASDGLSFTHPDLTSGDLVLFTYAYSKESTNGNITASFYDSNVVKIDTVTGKAYRINEVVTNGVLTRTLTEV